MSHIHQEQYDNLYTRAKARTETVLTNTKGFASETRATVLSRGLLDLILGHLGVHVVDGIVVSEDARS